MNIVYIYIYIYLKILLKVQSKYKVQSTIDTFPICINCSIIIGRKIFVYIWIFFKALRQRLCRSVNIFYEYYTYMFRFVMPIVLYLLVFRLNLKNIFIFLAVGIKGFYWLCCFFIIISFYINAFWRKTKSSSRGNLLHYWWSSLLKFTLTILHHSLGE